MPLLAHILRALYGAVRLARFERDGFDAFDTTATGATLSFLAALILMPVDIGLTLLQEQHPLIHIDPLRFWLVQAIAFVLSWTAYAVMMADLSGMLGRANRYFGFLAAYNWSMVIQTSLYVPAYLIAETGMMPAEALGLLGLAITLIAMIYQGYITMVALDVPAATACPLVLLDLVVSLLISACADQLLTGVAGATGT